MQTKQFHVIPNTLFPCLPTPAPTSRPLHHQPSASRHPIIHTLIIQLLLYPMYYPEGVLPRRDEGSDKPCAADWAS